MTKLRGYFKGENDYFIDCNRQKGQSDMTMYNLIETNHGDSKILTTGTLSEILNYLQDNPRIYEWVQDEIVGDPAMTDDQKAADLESLQIDLTDIDSVDDLQRELDKVNLTWWDLKVEEVMVKFEILWDYVNVRKLDQMAEGATLDLSDGDSTDPELIKAFSTKEEALRELGKYHSSYKKLSDSTGALYRFEEFRVEENHYNEEGELTNYIGVWGYSKYKPDLIGRFEGENDYFIEDYKVVNEPAEKELYIYKFDPDSENYEHYDKMPMPDFWEDYIFNASKNNPIIEEAFENEIKNYLSL